MGTGSNKHVVGLDAVIHLFSSSCPIVVKHCIFSLGVTNETITRRCRSYICYCISDAIQFISKEINILLNCEGIFSSGDV